MPTYEYECRKCGHAFEQVQSIKAEPLKKCPACGKAGVKRLLGAGAGLIFKGSGFYQTDYRSASYHQGAKADVAKPDTPSSGGSAGAKGAAAKPESATTPKPAAGKSSAGGGKQAG